MILAESALCLGGEVPVAPYRLSANPEFAELIAGTLGDGAAVIWGNPGAMVVGINLALTFSTAHALENSAKVYTIRQATWHTCLTATRGDYQATRFLAR